MITLPQIPAMLKTREYLNTKRTVRAISRNITGSLASCKSYLLCSDCHFPVVADLTNIGAEFNDTSSFIFLVETGNIVTATLTNVETGVDNIIVDDTYGTFYATGTLKTQVWGFVIDWNKVANSLGFGNYTFNVKINNGISADFEEETCYKLVPFTCDNADGTVRITTHKNGFIVNGFDYRDLSIGDWVEQVRLYGRFSLEDHVIEQDNLQSTSRLLRQIQTQIVDNFQLSLTEIKSATSTQLIKDDLLANRLSITDYNTNNVDNIIEKFVVPISIETPIHAIINGTFIYNIKFTEEDRATLKRNF